MVQYSSLCEGAVLNSEDPARHELSDGGPWSRTLRDVKQHLLSELDDFTLVVPSRL